MSSLMTTAYAGTAPMFTACTTYSSVAPAIAGPPPTTDTAFVIRSVCTLPTTTTVGSGPVAGLPSPSVSTLRSSALDTVAWFVISVPGGTPALTRRSNCTVAISPGDTVPAPAAGNGGVRFDELTSRPAISGDTPPSGRPTGRPFSVIESATYVVFAGTTSRSTTCVDGSLPLLRIRIV